MIAEKYPFKEVEHYFTDSFLYHDSLETDENLQPEEPDSGNEEECLWEINLLVTGIYKLDFNNTTNIEGEWFIIEDLDLVYFSAFTSIPYRQTSIDVDVTNGQQ